MIQKHCSCLFQELSTQGFLYVFHILFLLRGRFFIVYVKHFQTYKIVLFFTRISSAVSLRLFFECKAPTSSATI